MSKRTQNYRSAIQTKVLNTNIIDINTNSSIFILFVLIYRSQSVLNNIKLLMNGVAIQFLITHTQSVNKPGKIYENHSVDICTIIILIKSTS